MGLLDHEPRVVTVGASLFAQSLDAQAVDTVAVDWRPPAGDPDGRLAASLARVFADPRRAAANETAVGRMLAAGAHLVDVRPAAEALGL